MSKVTISSRTAIAALATVIIIVLIVGAVAVGTFIAFGNHAAPPNTASSSSTSTSISETTSTSSSSTTSSSTSTSAAPTTNAQTTITSSSPSCPTIPYTGNQSSFRPPSGFGGNMSLIPPQILSPIKSLLGNFSEMSVHEVSRQSMNIGASTPPPGYLPPNMTQYELPPSMGLQNSSTTNSASYSVNGTQIVNGTKLTLINFSENTTISGGGQVYPFGPGGSQNQSGTIFVDQAGNIVLVRGAGGAATGSFAEGEAMTILVPFLSVLGPSQMNSSSSSISPFNLTSYLTVINQTKLVLGNHLTMNVTNYKLTPPADDIPFASTNSSLIHEYSQCFGSPINQQQSPPTNITFAMYVQIGRLPTTGQEIAPFFDAKTSYLPFGTSEDQIRLISLRAANSTSTLTFTSTSPSK